MSATIETLVSSGVLLEEWQAISPIGLRPTVQSRRSNLHLVRRPRTAVSTMCPAILPALVLQVEDEAVDHARPRFKDNVPVELKRVRPAKVAPARCHVYCQIGKMLPNKLHRFDRIWMSVS